MIDEEQYDLLGKAGFRMLRKHSATEQELRVLAPLEEGDSYIVITPNWSGTESYVVRTKEIEKALRKTNHRTGPQNPI